MLPGETQKMLSFCRSEPKVMWARADLHHYAVWNTSQHILPTGQKLLIPSLGWIAIALYTDQSQHVPDEPEDFRTLQLDDLDGPDWTLPAQ